MSSPDECRAQVDKYLAQARLAQTTEECRLHLALALTWLQQLTLVDDMSQIHLPPTPTIFDAVSGSVASKG